jgi:hypothetical protein
LGDWFGTAGINLADMELFAITYACQHKGTPWRSMKFISGQANDYSSADWQANVRRGEELFVRWFFDEFLAQPMPPEPNRFPFWLIDFVIY